MKLGIVGLGTVGWATYQGLKNYHDIFLYDKKRNLTKHDSGKHVSGSLTNLVRNSEIIFVCVPTPLKRFDGYDTSIVRQVISRIMSINHKEMEDSAISNIAKGKMRIIAIRSTMPPGGTKKIHYSGPYKLAVNPEFLRDKHALDDFNNADRIIIGAEEKSVFTKVKRVYTESGFTCPIIHVNLTTAELIKSFNNAFLSLKVTFANEMFQIARLFGVDYNTLAECVALDKRFGPGKYDVPGPDGDYGFAGRCLPKDLMGLMVAAREKGYSPYLLEEVWRSNLRFRTKVNHPSLKERA